MPQALDTVSFIRNRLKYSAAKCYVASLSAVAIHNLWRTFNETENSGCTYSIYVGRITTDILRAAFLREMAYNPLRFGGVSLDSKKDCSQEVGAIIDSIQGILSQFNDLWPAGIADRVSIVDIADPQYHFLRELRDCFKDIARLNLADFKKAAYRDEIIAHFANAVEIPMTPDMRAALRGMANASAARRENIRTRKELARRLSAIETEMKIHRGHDREFYTELLAEHDSLRTQLDGLRAVSRARSKPNIRHASPASVPPAPVVMEDGGDVTDAAEREIELLSTMTPEHATDEIFQDYMEHMLGLRVGKFNGDHQR
ncbi:MAG: hypothetical protein K2L25_01215 [Alphaproteobacteria bacterium]|nr:hypothetical protein [Alphaproteobacteria bacterium]